MRLLIASLVAVWLSVGLTTLGALLRSNSPRFSAWERRVFDDVVASNPDFDGPGIGVAMGMSPAFEGVFNGVIALVFTSGLLLSRAMIRRGRSPALLVPAGFGLGSLWGAYLGFVAGFECLGWGFAVLGLGYWLAGLGLVGGVVAVAAQTPNHALQRTRPAAAPAGDS